MPSSLAKNARMWAAYHKQDTATDLLVKCADALEAAAKVVGELPMYPHVLTCSWMTPGSQVCDCGAMVADARRLAARKAVGLEG